MVADRRSVMPIVDQMPAPLRDLVNEYGWNAVVRFIGAGVLDAAEIERQLRRRRQLAMQAKGVEPKS